jgi:hypothetical protein
MMSVAVLLSNVMVGQITADEERFRVGDTFDTCTPKLAQEGSLARFGIEPATRFETLGWLCTVPGCNNSRWCKDVSTCSNPVGETVIMSMFPAIIGTGPPWCTGPTQCINGGVPQRANISAQLKLVRENINIWLPDPHWNGDASMDFEQWSPVWEENVGSDEGQSFHSRAYQDYSIQLAREAHPNLNTTAATKFAKAEFTRAAVGFMAAVLNELHRLRPNARFGLYGIPNNDYCNFVAGKNCFGQRGPTLRARNDALLPLWQASGVIFPCVYLVDGFSDAEQWTFVSEGVAEAVRCAELANNTTGRRPHVLAFQWSWYHGGRNQTTHAPTNQGDGTVAVSAPQVPISFKAAYESGADGLVMWDCPPGWGGRGGSPNTIESRLKVSRQQFFGVVGPAVASVQQAITNCSTTRCSGHGSCAGLFHGTTVAANSGGARSAPTCHCDAGWHGAQCDGSEESGRELPAAASLSGVPRVQGLGQTPLEVLAAQEVARYWGELSGTHPQLELELARQGLPAALFQDLADIKFINRTRAARPRIIVATRTHPIHELLRSLDSSHATALDTLADGDDSHLIHSLRLGGSGPGGDAAPVAEQMRAVTSFYTIICDRPYVFPM